MLKAAFKEPFSNLDSENNFPSKPMKEEQQTCIPLKNKRAIEEECYVGSEPVCTQVLLEGFPCQSILDSASTVNIINEEDVTLGHEAAVSKVGEQQLFYLMSRGLSEAQATSLIVNGFIEPIVKVLPMEYAIEMNRLIEMEMTGSVG